MFVRRSVKVSRILVLALPSSSRPSSWIESQARCFSESGSQSKGNRFTRQLEDYIWLDEQKAQYEQMKAELHRIAATGKGGDSIADLRSQLETLEETLRLQEDTKLQLEQDFARDKAIMWDWLKDCGVPAAQIEATVLQLVENGYDYAMLRVIKPADVSKLKFPEDVAAAILKRLEQQAKKQPPKDRDRVHQQAKAEEQLYTVIKTAIVIVVLVGLTVFWLVTSETFRAVYRLCQKYKPKAALPDLYVPREDVEKSVRSFFGGDDSSKSQIGVLVGPQGSGKTALAHHCANKLRGVCVVTVQPNDSEAEIMRKVAGMLGAPQSCTDMHSFVSKIFGRARTFLRHPGVLVLDSAPEASFNGTGVAGLTAVATAVAKKQKLCPVLITASPAQEVSSLIKETGAATFYLRDFTNGEAREITQDAGLNLTSVASSVGLRPGVLQSLRQHSISVQEIIESAEAEIKKCSTKAKRKALGELACAEFEAGMPLVKFAQLCNGSADEALKGMEGCVLVNPLDSRVRFATKALQNAARAQLVDSQRWWKFW